MAPAGKTGHWWPHNTNGAAERVSSIIIRKFQARDVCPPILYCCRSAVILVVVRQRHLLLLVLFVRLFVFHMTLAYVLVHSIFPPIRGVPAHTSTPQYFSMRQRQRKPSYCSFPPLSFTWNLASNVIFSVSTKAESKVDASYHLVYDVHPILLCTCCHTINVTPCF